MNTMKAKRRTPPEVPPTNFLVGSYRYLCGTIQIALRHTVLTRRGSIQFAPSRAR